VRVDGLDNTGFAGRCVNLNEKAKAKQMALRMVSAGGDMGCTKVGFAPAQTSVTIHVMPAQQLYGGDRRSRTFRTRNEHASRNHRRMEVTEPQPVLALGGIFDSGRTQSFDHGNLFVLLRCFLNFTIMPYSSRARSLGLILCVCHWCA
jgi:hypothetical protein